jgi:hypothetical protein
VKARQIDHGAATVLNERPISYDQSRASAVTLKMEKEVRAVLYRVIQKQVHTFKNLFYKNY